MHHVIGVGEGSADDFAICTDGADGRHRRIKAENLFAYKRARNEKRSEALGALAALDGEPL
jgi:hypothetical protein